MFIFNEEIKTENMNNEFELREYEKTLKITLLNQNKRINFTIIEN